MLVFSHFFRWPQLIFGVFTRIYVCVRGRGGQGGSEHDSAQTVLSIELPFGGYGILAYTNIWHRVEIKLCIFGAAPSDSLNTPFYFLRASCYFLVASCCFLNSLMIFWERRADFPRARIDSVPKLKFMAFSSEDLKNRAWVWKFASFKKNIFY